MQVPLLRQRRDACIEQDSIQRLTTSDLASERPLAERTGRAGLWLARFTQVIKVGDVEIDILNRTVRAGASELDLASLEQGLL